MLLQGTHNSETEFRRNSEGNLFRIESTGCIFWSCFGGFIYSMALHYKFSDRSLYKVMFYLWVNSVSKLSQG